MRAIVLLTVLALASARPQGFSVQKTSVPDEYTYTDEHGVIHHLRYISATDRFEEISLSNVQNSLEAENKYSGPPAVVRFAGNGMLADTPEVEAAKQEHERAHAAVRAFLPVLPPEPTTRTLTPHVVPTFVPQPHINHHVQPFPTHFIPDVKTAEPVQTKHFTQFAEEIPRSAFGETPEVAAAREAHIQNYLHVRANLPELATTTIPSSLKHAVESQFSRDTPDVLAAKAKHFAAFAALKGSGPGNFPRGEEIVQDTPEVAAAKAQHLAAHAAARSL